MSIVSVIMYHYVRDLKNSKYPNIKGLETELFRQQILYLKKNYNFITAEDLISSVFYNYQLPPKSVLLTFDDGYIDHYQNVFPILQDFGIKGSFYIPAQTVMEHKVLDVNKIHFILAASSNTNDIVTEIKYFLNNLEEPEIKDFEYYYKKLAVRSRFDSPDVIFIKRLLQVELKESFRSKIIDFLFEKYVKIEEAEFAKNLYLNEIQIKEMKDSGMHIGCHGYNHYWWNRMESHELEKEIDLSLAFLENIGVDITNWTASYPYGSFSNSVEDLLRKKKCRLAFTTEVGVTNVNENNHLLINRLDTNDIPKSESAKTNTWFNHG